jgi:hypothetical protein
MGDADDFVDRHDESDAHRQLDQPLLSPQGRAARFANGSNPEVQGGLYSTARGQERTSDDNNRDCVHLSVHSA